MPPPTAQIRRAPRKDDKLGLTAIQIKRTAKEIGDAQNWSKSQKAKWVKSWDLRKELAFP